MTYILSCSLVKWPSSRKTRGCHLLR